MKQKPNWTKDDIPDLTDKIIVITGANSGIGFEATKLFLSKNALVIMACRSMEKAEQAKSILLNEMPKAKLDLLELDLSRFSSIHHFSHQLHKKYERIDVLLNNAGVMMTPFSRTQDGLELQQGINHFGHFLLTGLLLDMLCLSTDARIVNIASLAHKGGKLDFNNLMYEDAKKYGPIKAYARSKLENILFTYELSRRIKQANMPIKVLAAHPGVSHTNLGRHINKTMLYKIWSLLMKRFSQDAAMGCLPGVRASTDPTAKSGEYYGPSGWMQLKGYPVVVVSSKRSHRKEMQKQLWKVSELRTNITYP
jgi:NAD(P)-dependent dehydrogenase (short-subunit alcohol dehydrogenase family)